MMKLRGLAMFLLSAVFLAGCAKATPEPVHFTIDMTEYKFEPAEIEVQVGQEVALELINSGVLPHEIMFGRNVTRENNRPHGYEIDMFEAAHVEPKLSHPDGMAMEPSHEEGHQGSWRCSRKPATGPC